VSGDFLTSIQAVQTDMLYFNEVSIKFVQIQSDMKSMITAMHSKRIQVKHVVSLLSRNGGKSNKWLKPDKT